MKIRFYKIQVIRRIIQILILAIILLIPAVARYNNYLLAREVDKFIEKWEHTLQGNVISGIDTAFRSFPDGEEERSGNMVRNRHRILKYAQSMRGGPWSVEIAGVSMTDPLAGVETIAASKTAVPPLLISLIIPVVLALIFGRVYCTWACPMGLLLEFTGKLRSVIRFLELKTSDIQFSRWIKFVLLATGLIMSVIISLPVLGYIYPPAIMGRELHDLVYGIFDRAEDGNAGFWVGGLTWMSLIILGIAMFEIAVSKRWWCKYVCPGGALYCMIGLYRVVRVKRSSAKCTQCADCVRVCPMGLAPMSDKFGIECDNCGICISCCGDKALGYSLSVSDKPKNA